MQPCAWGKNGPQRAAFTNASPEGLEAFPAYRPFAKFLEAAYSGATRLTYKREVAHFIRWGGLIPCAPETIATYLAVHAPLLARATLSKKLAALHRAHLSLGHKSPVRTDLVRDTLRGIGRIHCRKQRQVRPLLKNHLEVILNHMRGISGVRDRALLLLGFLGGFRRSELTNLEVEDMSFSEAGMVVRLRRSKTDQQGMGRDVPIPKLGSELCAVKAIKDWLQASEISRGPIFRKVNRAGAVGKSKITSGMVARIIKKYISIIGLDAREYSGHSLRAGLVTSAAIAGAAEWQIRKQTGHKSNEMVGRYIRQSEMFSDNVATMIANFSAGESSNL